MVEKISDELLKNIIDKSPMGLFYGRIGACIYLFHNNDSDAPNILKGACNSLNSIKCAIDMPNGLSGVAIAMLYLHKNKYLNGEIKPMLHEIDDLIFREIAFDKNIKKYNLCSLIQLLYYEIKRTKIESAILNYNDEYLQRELTTTLINRIFELSFSECFIEPMHYSLDYLLPQFLYVMGELANINLYRSRVEVMMRELSPIILYKMPINHANRLYLLVAIDRLLKSCGAMPEWKEYRSLLVANIDIPRIFDIELKRSIYIIDGVSSAYFLMKIIPEFSGYLAEYRERIIEMIDCSTEIKLLSSNESYFRNHIGLYNGYCGVALAQLLMKNNK